jgi:hypothetical protein
MFDAKRYNSLSEAGISKKYCATNSGFDHIVQIFELGGLN